MVEECKKLIDRNYYHSNLERKERIRKRNNSAKDKLRDYVAKILESGCVDCGNKDIRVLEFDHIEGKDYSISSLIRSASNMDKLNEELSKCEVRCANCHRIRYSLENNNWRNKYLKMPV